MNLNFDNHTTTEILAAATAAFNAGIITMEAAFEVANRCAVKDMVDFIKSTNNGYIFAPTEAQIELAKANPETFIYRHFPTNTFFPHNISLR